MGIARTAINYDELVKDDRVHGRCTRTRHLRGRDRQNLLVRSDDGQVGELDATRRGAQYGYRLKTGTIAKRSFTQPSMSPYCGGAGSAFLRAAQFTSCVQVAIATK